jgi:hypothetical protein
MGKKNKKKPYERTQLYKGVVSATECTGLTAKVPENEDEADSYKDIYGIPVEPNVSMIKKKK